MQASLKNYRQSPRKVRLVADLIRGKDVTHALTVLSFLPKRAAGPIKKLLQSAVANAKNGERKDPESLIIKKMEVDGGITFKRIEYRARGSSNIIKKRTSRVFIELGDKPADKKAKKVEKVEDAKPKADIKDKAKKTKPKTVKTKS